MTKLTYDSVVRELRNTVPEVFEEFEIFEDLPYDVFGTLAQAIRQWIVDGRWAALDRGFPFLDRMARSGDEGVLDLLEHGSH